MRSSPKDTNLLARCHVRASRADQIEAMNALVEEKATLEKQLSAAEKRLAVSNDLLYNFFLLVPIKHG